MAREPRLGIVLGLNGCHPRSHDASACLVINGKVEAFAEEERFIRRKRAFDTYPINASRYCLTEVGISENDIDAIAVGSNMFDHRKDDCYLERWLPSPVFNLKKKIPLHFVPHHLAHAASVFFVSKMKEAAILTLDGQGEQEATSLFVGRGRTIDLVKQYPVERSLGFLYAAVSVFCGLGTFGAGKLMGLAPYGRPKYKESMKDIFNTIKFSKEKNLDLQDQYIQKFNEGLRGAGFRKAHMTVSQQLTRGILLKVPHITQEHKDLARSAQSFLEDQVLSYAREVKEMTGSENLCLSGGVALNCVANSKLENSGTFKKIFIQPACEDSGSAMGAALSLSKRNLGLSSPYLGPAFSNREIKGLLKERKIRHKQSNDVSMAAAAFLVAGKVVGWFQGAMECGPRALGNRSILADPRRKGMMDKVNNIKGRELWRPFGPSVIEEKANLIFENYVRSPYMLKSFTVKDSWRAKISAVVHVDGSTRPQTVARTQNERFYHLLVEFEKRTGVPLVLNTSFNYAGEPLVCSPADAIKTFFSTGLDVLIMEDCIVLK